MEDSVVPDPQADAHRVAQIALFVLRAVVPQREGKLSGRVLMQPESVLLSEQAAAEHLARMKKPVECEASVQADVLVVECRDLSARNKPLHESHVINLADDREKPDWWGRYDSRAPDGEGSILLVGRGREEMRVHADELEGFSRDYVLMHGYSRVGDDPTVEESQRGITYGFYFAPSWGRNLIIPSADTLDL